MRRVLVVNRTRGTVLADKAELANSHWTRLWGLMGRRELPDGGGLVLQPGGAIHMFFMRIPLDVVHTNRDLQVTHVLRGIRPWRLGPLFVGRGPTIELPVGAAVTSQPGDQIEIRPVD
jgi:uncharacterized membrane protein (UPF0127 family)